MKVAILIVCQANCTYKTDMLRIGQVGYMYLFLFFYMYARSRYASSKDFFI